MDLSVKGVFPFLLQIISLSASCKLHHTHKKMAETVVAWFSTVTSQHSAMTEFCAEFACSYCVLVPLRVVQLPPHRWQKDLAFALK